MADITWSFSIPIKDVNTIDYVEGLFSVKFPRELKDLILKHNGGHPSLDKCRIPGYGETDFKLLLSYNDDDDETVFDVLEYFVKKYHKRVIPFASDSGSGYYCVKDDYIVFCSDNLTAPIPLAENMTVFLNSFF